MNQTFSSFKERFYGRNKDLTLFDCMEFNLLKVVLDGLFVDYASKSKLFVYFHYPVFLVRIIFFLKRIQYKSNIKKIKQELSFINDKKIILRGTYKLEQGVKSSRVFNNITKELSSDSYCFINDVRLKDTNSKADLDLAYLYNDVVYQSLSKEEVTLLKELQNTYSKIEKESKFDKLELINIRFAIQKFFLDYLKWSRILKESKAKYFIFRCHYHFEGMLLALKRKGIKTIELQHGLIAEEDIFYVMPKVVAIVAERALFADEIWVYGEAWKNTLLKGGEYPVGKIKFFGYYVDDKIVVNESLLNILNVKKGRKVILVTTQTGLHEKFIEYINWLKVDMNNKGLWMSYLIVIKAHQNEEKGIYNELLEQDNVCLYEGNIDSIFNESDIMLSVYSTTIIEALRFKINCYSLFVERYSDYIDSFVKKGYSRKLFINDNIIEMNNRSSYRVDPESLFAPINIELIKSLN